MRSKQLGSRSVLIAVVSAALLAASPATAIAAATETGSTACNAPRSVDVVSRASGIVGVAIADSTRTRSTSYNNGPGLVTRHFYTGFRSGTWSVNASGNLDYPATYGTCL